MNFFTDHENLLYLKRKKARIFLCGIGAVVIYILLFLFYPKAQVSSAVIYSSNKNKTEGVQLSTSNALQEVGESYTIINWVYSTQLIDYLILKFNLITHYNIDPKKPEAYTACFNNISKNINVNLTPYGAVKITVSDKDKYLAADIANEILKQIDRLNKLKVIENRKSIIQEYDFLLKEFSNDVNSQRDSVNKLLAIFSSLTNEKGVSLEKKELTLNSLANASRNYEKLSNDWLTLRKVHLLSLKEIEKYNLPSFVIVQHALPQLQEPFFSVDNVGFMALVFVFGIWLAIVFFLIQFKYSEHLRFIFSNSASEGIQDKLFAVENETHTPYKTNGKETGLESAKKYPNNN